MADYLRAALVQDGLSEAEARSRFWMVDKDGLLHTGRTDLAPEQRVYAQPAERVASWPRTSHGAIGLADVIGRTAATVLIGLSTVAGAFTCGHCPPPAYSQVFGSAHATCAATSNSSPVAIAPIPATLPMARIVQNLTPGVERA